MTEGDGQEPHKKGLSANWAVTEVDHLISALGRYTRFVVLSKWFLVLFALALTTALIGLPLLTKDRSGIRVSFVDRGPGTTQDAAHPVMSNPEFHGLNDKGEQYTVSGLRATQLTPEMVLMEPVTGHLDTDNGGTRDLSASQAHYNQVTKVIELTGNVTLTDDQGYTFLTQQATVDSKTNHIEGHEPVTGNGPLGNLLASGFEIRDSGKEIIFTGGTEPVRVHIDRKKQ